MRFLHLECIVSIHTRIMMKYSLNDSLQKEFLGALRLNTTDNMLHQAVKSKGWNVQLA